MRLILNLEYDALLTQGALRRMRRIRQGVIGGCARTHRPTRKAGESALSVPRVGVFLL